MRYRTASIVAGTMLTAAAAHLLTSSPAWADDQPVLVTDPAKFKLKVDGTKATASIDVINPAPTELRLATTPVAEGDSECEATSATATIPPHRHVTISVAFTGCEPGTTNSGQFTLVGPGATQLFEPATAVQDPEPEVNWNHLWWFVYCALGGFAALTLAYLFWLLTAKKPATQGAGPAGTRPSG